MSAFRAGGPGTGESRDEEGNELDPPLGTFNEASRLGSIRRSQRAGTSNNRRLPTQDDAAMSNIFTSADSDNFRGAAGPLNSPFRALDSPFPPLFQSPRRGSFLSPPRMLPNGLNVPTGVSLNNFDGLMLSPGSLAGFSPRMQELFAGTPHRRTGSMTADYFLPPGRSCNLSQEFLDLMNPNPSSRPAQAPVPARQGQPEERPAPHGRPGQGARPACQASQPTQAANPHYLQPHDNRSQGPLQYPQYAEGQQRQQHGAGADGAVRGAGTQRGSLGGDAGPAQQQQQQQQVHHPAHLSFSQAQQQQQMQQVQHPSAWQQQYGVPPSPAPATPCGSMQCTPKGTRDGPMEFDDDLLKAVFASPLAKVANMGFPRPGLGSGPGTGVAGGGGGIRGPAPSPGFGPGPAFGPVGPHGGGLQLTIQDMLLGDPAVEAPEPVRDDMAVRGRGGYRGDQQSQRQQPGVHAAGFATEAAAGGRGRHMEYGGGAEQPSLALGAGYRGGQAGAPAYGTAASSHGGMLRASGGAGLCAPPALPRLPVLFAAPPPPPPTHAGDPHPPPHPTPASGSQHASRGPSPQLQRRGSAPLPAPKPELSPPEAAAHRTLPISGLAFPPIPPFLTGSSSGGYSDLGSPLPPGFGRMGSSGRDGDGGDAQGGPTLVAGAQDRTRSHPSNPLPSAPDAAAAGAGGLSAGPAAAREAASPQPLSSSAPPGDSPVPPLLSAPGSGGFSASGGGLGGSGGFSGSGGLRGLPPRPSLAAAVGGTPGAGTPATQQRPQRARAASGVHGAAVAAAMAAEAVAAARRATASTGRSLSEPGVSMLEAAQCGGPLQRANSGNGSVDAASKGRRSSDAGAKSCRCKKSQCLKLYCDCFAAGQFCRNCSCAACLNRPEHAERVQQRREDIVQRDPQAFTRKIQDGNGSNPSHARGCNCRRSHCLKKYCECYSGGVSCGSNCKCTECENMGEPSPLPGGRGGVGRRGGAAARGRASTSISSGGREASGDLTSSRGGSASAASPGLSYQAPVRAGAGGRQAAQRGGGGAGRKVAGRRRRRADESEEESSEVEDWRDEEEEVEAAEQGQNPEVRGAVRPSMILQASLQELLSHQWQIQQQQQQMEEGGLGEQESKPQGPAGAATLPGLSPPHRSPRPLNAGWDAEVLPAEQVAEEGEGRASEAPRSQQQQPREPQGQQPGDAFRAPSPPPFPEAEDEAFGPVDPPPPMAVQGPQRPGPLQGSAGDSAQPVVTALSQPPASPSRSVDAQPPQAVNEPRAGLAACDGAAAGADGGNASAGAGAATADAVMADTGVALQPGALPACAYAGPETRPEDCSQAHAELAGDQPRAAPRGDGAGGDESGGAYDRMPSGGSGTAESDGWPGAGGARKDEPRPLSAPPDAAAEAPADAGGAPQAVNATAAARTASAAAPSADPTGLFTPRCDLGELGGLTCGELLDLGGLVDPLDTFPFMSPSAPNTAREYGPGPFGFLSMPQLPSLSALQSPAGGGGAGATSGAAATGSHDADAAGFTPRRAAFAYMFGGTPGSVTPGCLGGSGLTPRYRPSRLGPGGGTATAAAAAGVPDFLRSPFGGGGLFPYDPLHTPLSPATVAFLTGGPERLGLGPGSAQPPRRPAGQAPGGLGFGPGAALAVAATGVHTLVAPVRTSAAGPPAARRLTPTKRKAPELESRGTGEQADRRLSASGAEMEQRENWVADASPSKQPRLTAAAPATQPLQPRQHAAAAAAAGANRGGGRGHSPGAAPPGMVPARELGSMPRMVPLPSLPSLGPLPSLPLQPQPTAPVPQQQPAQPERRQRRSSGTGSMGSQPPQQPAAEEAGAAKGGNGRGAAARGGARGGNAASQRSASVKEELKANALEYITQRLGCSKPPQHSQPPQQLPQPQQLGASAMSQMLMRPTASNPAGGGAAAGPAGGPQSAAAGTAPAGPASGAPPPAVQQPQQPASSLWQPQPQPRSQPQQQQQVHLPPPPSQQPSQQQQPQLSHTTPSCQDIQSANAAFASAGPPSLAHSTNTLPAAPVAASTAQGGGSTAGGFASPPATVLRFGGGGVANGGGEMVRLGTMTKLGSGRITIFSPQHVDQRPRLS